MNNRIPPFTRIFTSILAGAGAAAVLPCVAVSKLIPGLVGYGQVHHDYRPRMISEVQLCRISGHSRIFYQTMPDFHESLLTVQKVPRGVPCLPAGLRMQGAPASFTSAF
jgi:hypothetical protein